MHGFPETLQILWKNNVSSAAPLHAFHVGQPGQRENHGPTLGNPWKNRYPAIAILCRPQLRPRPVHGFPKTLEILRKFNDSQGRARLAAANSELVDLQCAVKFRGIPTENVISTHGSFASQRRQGSRSALVALAEKNVPAKIQYIAPARLLIGMFNC